jgi:LuxR family maltose regulon positive regulatory protein
MKGEIEHAVQAIRKTLSNPAWPANIRARIHFYLAIISYMEADLDGAIAASRECLRLVRGYPFTHTTTFAWYLIGAAHYWRNETAEAESHLLKVLADYHLSNPSYTGNAGFVMACICLARNCAQKADQVLKQVSNHFREYNYATMLAITQAFRVESALRQGDIGKARQMSKHLDFDVRPPIWFFYVPQLTPIKLLLAEGTDESLEKASRRLSELDRQLDRINRKSVRIDVLAMLALVFWKQGEHTAALEKLQAALDLAAPGGWIRNFVDLGAPMTDMLERLNRIQPGNPFAEKVLAACKAEADDQRSANRVAAVPSDVTDDLSGILTHRELELLPLLAEGLSNKEIASKLFISAVTVKAHLRNIYRKLDARGRIEALRKASALGIIRTG